MPSSTTPAQQARASNANGGNRSSEGEDDGDSGNVQVRKCRNRECKNLAGQPLKPRSPYCSKRCQAREQNMRQGRIKGHSKRPHLLNLLERQRQNICEADLADICGGQLDIVNYSESVGNHLSLCMLNGRPVLVNIKIDDKAEKLDKVLPSDAFLISPKNLGIMNVHTPENQESERVLKEMYGLSPSSSEVDSSLSGTQNVSPSNGRGNTTTMPSYMPEFPQNNNQRVILPPIKPTAGTSSSAMTSSDSTMRNNFNMYQGNASSTHQASHSSRVPSLSHMSNGGYSLMYSNQSSNGGQISNFYGEHIPSLKVPTM